MLFQKAILRSLALLFDSKLERSLKPLVSWCLFRPGKWCRVWQGEAYSPREASLTLLVGNHCCLCTCPGKDGEDEGIFKGGYQSNLEECLLHHVCPESKVFSWAVDSCEGPALLTSLRRTY